MDILGDTLYLAEVVKCLEVWFDSYAFFLGMYRVPLRPDWFNSGSLETHTESYTGGDYDGCKCSEQLA